MLWTLALILLVLYVIGNMTAFVTGALLHLILVAAIVVVIIRVFKGRPSEPIP